MQPAYASSGLPSRFSSVSFGQSACAVFRSARWSLTGTGIVVGSLAPPPATRLTQRHRSEAKGGVYTPVAKSIPRPERICLNCGAPLKHGRTHCAACAGPESGKRMLEIARLGRIATHSPKAEKQRAATRRRHAAALKSWQPSEHPRWLTEDVYLNQIQPALRDCTVSAIASALGVSLPYATDIRAGRRRPHPRHWPTLAHLVGIGL